MQQEGKEKNSHEKLEEVLKLSKENNRMLQKMRRNAAIGGIIKIVFYAILIGLPVALYYYILGPYIDQLQEVYTGIQGEIEGVRQLRDSLPDFGGLFGGDE